MVKEAPFTDNPCSSSSLSSAPVVSGVNVSVRRVNDTQHVSGSPKVTPSSGTVSFVNLKTTNPNEDNLIFTATKTTSGDNPDTYRLLCPTPQTYTVNLNANDCDTKTVTLGIQKVYKKGWSTSIDADIFANDVAVSIPQGEGLGGFSNVLVNSRGEIGGYTFAKGSISTNISRLHEANLGGYLFNLSRYNLPHNDVALEGFSFDPPKHDDVIELKSSDVSGSTLNISGGKVYKISSQDFNQIMSQSSSNLNYSIENTMSVLYITGNEEVQIKRPIKTLSSARIIIVSKPNVKISKDIGFLNLAEYTINAQPTIMASIISGGSIEFESKETTPASDIPIKLTAPLASKMSIDLKRDLGHEINAQYPAQSVLSYTRYLYLLSSLERQQDTHLNYTGLATFDVQYVFEY